MVAVSKRVGWRRRTWLIIAAIVVLLVAWVGLLSVKAWSAYRHDQKGLASLE